MRDGGWAVLSRFVAGVIALAVVACFVAIPAWISMLLWNYIAPNFGLPQVSFWVAFATWMLIDMIGSLFRGRRDA